MFEIFFSLHALGDGLWFENFFSVHALGDYFRK